MEPSVSGPVLPTERFPVGPETLRDAVWRGRGPESRPCPSHTIELSPEQAGGEAPGSRSQWWGWGALSPLRPLLQASGSFSGPDSAQRLWPLLLVPEGSCVGPSHPHFGVTSGPGKCSVLAARCQLTWPRPSPAPFPEVHFSLCSEFQTMQSRDGFRPEGLEPLRASRLGTPCWSRWFFVQ